MHLTDVEDGAAHVGVDVLADEDVGTIVAEEWRIDGTLLAAATKQFMKQGIPRRFLLPVGVEGVIEPAAALARRFELGIARIIGLPATIFCHSAPRSTFSITYSISQIRDS